MLFLPYQIGGTIDAYAAVYPTADPTVEVRTSAGAVVEAGTAASRDTVATTITSAATRGSYALSVTSATDIVVGRRYLLSPEVSVYGSPSEFVRVKSIDGLALTLWTPLVHNHASGASFAGTRLSYTLSAADCQVLDDYWRAIFSWGIGPGGATTQPPLEVMFGTTRHWPANPLTPQGLLADYPPLSKHISADQDLDEVCDRAWAMTCRRLSGSSLKVSDYIGTGRLKEAVYYAARYLCAETFGEHYEKERAWLEARFDREIEAFIATTPADENRDNIISPHEESGFASVKLQRSR